SLYRKSWSWRLVKDRIGLSTGKSPEEANSFSYQPPGAYPGTRNGPSWSDLSSSNSSVRSRSVTCPMPSQRGHIPPTREKVVFSAIVFAPFCTVMAPAAVTDGTLKEKAPGPPTCGSASVENRVRRCAFASVTLPTVDGTFAP